MTRKEAEELQAQWRQKGNGPCAHEHTALERSQLGNWTGRYACLTCGASLSERPRPGARREPKDEITHQ